MAKVGAPTKFSDEAAQIICEEIATGGGLAEAAKAAGITVTTLCKWLLDEDKKEFAEAYARAREIQADVNADAVVSISSDQSRDPSCRKVEADARKWRAAKQSNKYSDTQKHEHSGPGGGEIPVSVAITRVFVTPKRSE